MTLTIRALAPAEVEQFAAMVVEFYEDDPGEFPMPIDRALLQARQMLERPDRVRPMLLCDRSDVLGYAILVPYYSNEFGGDMIWLDELFIRRERRGQNWGSAFLERLKTWIHEQGLIRIDLEVHHDNPRARDLYLRHGFFMQDDRHLMAYQVANPNRLLEEAG